MINKTHHVSLNKLDDKLWRIFSLFIRLSAADSSGFCKCVTCGVIRHYTEIQAGHYIHRRHNATRFDERNVNCQCISCNIYNAGEEEKHEDYINKTFGEGTTVQLKRLSKGLHKLSREWYLEKIAEYQEKVKGLQI
jgi:hypothetical protein